MPSRAHPIAAAFLLTVSVFATTPFACSTARAAEPMPRLVSVSGDGEVKARPDMAYVTIGVEARKPTLADARAQVTATIDRVLALAKDLRIEPRYVDASQLQVQPEYRWNEKDSQRVLLGYVVSRQVEIELHDLERLGTLFERAVSAGANQLGGARLDSSKRKELEREALAKAVDDARLKADTLARAAGAKLGAVQALSASQGMPPQPMYKERTVMAAAPMADAAEQTYTTGEMTFSASVSAQYLLENP